MASMEDREAATPPLSSNHDEETNRDALPADKVKREVNLLSGIALVVGVIIGSSVFIPPKGVLTQTELVGTSLVVWAGCGILALLGILCHHEMSTMIHKSGAEHSYLFEAFGPLPAFLYSWTLSLIIRPYSLGVVALTFAHYVSQPFYTDHEISLIPTRKILAATCLGEYHVLTITLRRKKKTLIFS